MSQGTSIKRSDPMRLRISRRRARTSQSRVTRSEVRYVSSVDIAEVQKRADELAKNYRDLDVRIQALNWNTELLQ